MEFQKNEKLDELITYLNSLLKPVEERILTEPDLPGSELPALFLIGTPRSGSTLFMQWIASTGAFSYPTNFMSRFPGAPYIAALIQNMVADPTYDYREEFYDIKRTIEFRSEIGKTRGFMAPHEFWYFWRRFFDFNLIPDDEALFASKFDFETFQNELKLLKHAFQKPFFLKAHTIVWYLETISKQLNNVIYVHLDRDSIDTVHSMLKAREKWTGSLQHWFSVCTREYEKLVQMDPYHQVAGQIFFVKREISEKRHLLGDNYIHISYEEFCEKPAAVFQKLQKKIKELLPGYQCRSYNGVKRFDPSNSKSDRDVNIINAYRYFEKNYGKIYL